MPVKLTAESVEAIFMDCLFREGEDTSGAKVVDGVISKFGFHPQRLSTHKEAIGALLAELPAPFQPVSLGGGGGWSFLNACLTKEGKQWGEHRSIEQLLALGIATEQAVLLLPREVWPALPGGMPYFGVVGKA